MDADPALLEGRAALAARVLEAVGDARQEVLLASHALDRQLYGSEALVETMQRFLLASERARLLILVNQGQAAARGGHRLVELARRLPSRIECRDPPVDRLDEVRGETLIVDERCVLLREAADSLEARDWREAPLVARRHRQRFLALWEVSTPSRELRVLGL